MGAIVGIDEVGRGSWAGPLLVVAASCKTDLPEGLKDSKLLSKLKRQELFETIKETCSLGEGWVQPDEIDKHGLTKAMRIGVSRALIALGTALDDDVIMDGIINYCPKEFIRVRCEAKADMLHPIVSAASIYAKVMRDNYMARISRFYPGYDFEKHVGYGTKLHREKLAELGVSLIHRRSYKPVKTFIV